MINHARTLLMNVDGSAPFPEYLAEEIVDPAYRALDLPTPLDQVRRVLFGADPDRHMRNYRCRQLLALAHATPLSPYLDRLDARRTYAFASSAVVSPEPWEPKVTVVRGTGTLGVLGDVEPPDATGRMYHSVLVSVDLPAVAAVERATRPFQKTLLDFAPSERLPLAGTGVDFRLASTETGQAYHVELLGRPRRDLGELADAATGLGEPVFNYLFGVTRAEPYRTFRELWFRKKELPLRLSALTCALVYRSDEVRLRG